MYRVVNRNFNLRICWKRVKIHNSTKTLGSIFSQFNPINPYNQLSITPMVMETRISKNLTGWAKANSKSLQDTLHKWIEIQVSFLTSKFINQTPLVLTTRISNNLLVWAKANNKPLQEPIFKWIELKVPYQTRKFIKLTLLVKILKTFLL